MEEVPLCEHHIDRTCHLDDDGELKCMACDAERFRVLLEEVRNGTVVQRHEEARKYLEDLDRRIKEALG
jgi:ketosteroid isomerase-like protein